MIKTVCRVRLSINLWYQCENDYIERILDWLQVSHMVAWCTLIPSHHTSIATKVGQLISCRYLGKIILSVITTNARARFSIMTVLVAHRMFITQNSYCDIIYSTTRGKNIHWMGLDIFFLWVWAEKKCFSWLGYGKNPVPGFIVFIYQENRKIPQTNGSWEDRSTLHKILDRQSDSRFAKHSPLQVPNTSWQHHKLG